MRNFAFIVILAFGTQYILAEPSFKLMQTTQSTVKQIHQSSKTMPPDPLEKKNIAGIRSKLTSLGFKVGKIQKLNATQWRVSVAGWDRKRTLSSNKGIIGINETSMPSGGGKCQLDSPCGSGKITQRSKSWDPTEVGHGTMMIEVDEDGFITFYQKGLNVMGLRANPQKMQGKFGIK